MSALDLFGARDEWRCALLDPPWAERGGGKIKRGADRHYDLASTDDIRKAILGSGQWTPAEHAHCWMWVTDNFLEDGLELLRALGFAYKRTFVWVKVRADRPAALDLEAGTGCEGLLTTDAGTPAVKIGIGQYGRGAHELLLFGVRGSGQDSSVWTGHRDVPSVLFAPHERDGAGKVIHSRKPRASYDLIERVSLGPRLECFARIARPGWRLWGNQAPEAALDEADHQNRANRAESAASVGDRRNHRASGSGSEPGENREASGSIARARAEGLS